MYSQKAAQTNKNHAWREGQSPKKFIPKESFKRAEKELEAA